MAKKNQPTAIDALSTLGTIIDGSQKRDAIHVAVIAMTAKFKVYPGQPIDENGNTPGIQGFTKQVGIVDPFLTQPVFGGESFWVLLNPRTITSLRHAWSHPDFPDEYQEPTKAEMEVEKIDASVKYIHDLAEQVGISYYRLLGAAANYIDSGDYITGGAEMEGSYVPDEFWKHYEIVTKSVVPEESRGSFFSCSC